MCRLASLPCFAILLAAVVFSPSARAGGPGPDETADAQTYDVQLNSRLGGAYSGQMVFLGDPSRPQPVEIGVLSVSLSSEESDSSEPPEAVDSPETPIESVAFAAEGTWAAAELWFFSFWLAVADSDSGDRLFAYGLSRSESIFGRAMILRGDTLDATRYRLRGDIAAAENGPVAPESAGDL
jgi:hypothetical protein